MKVLVYGNGAREHAIAWKIKQSKILTQLYLSNPNDGFSHLGKVIDESDFEKLAQRAKSEGIDLLVVGPEIPLVQGIADEFKKVGISTIGPCKEWALLEGSKSFAKEFMQRNNIKSAKYEIVTSQEQCEEVLNRFSLPVVLKADGLTAGKGVVICNTKQEAVKTIEEFLDGKFGEASKKIVVEEFLQGNEVSLISLWDGETLLPFIPARDYKKLLNGNNGPNTGGMGAYCPITLNNNNLKELEDYTDSLEKALVKENADFCGIIYSGLILTKDGIKVLEYNMRFGDPETQPLLMHLKSDLLELFNMAIKKELKKARLNWNNGTSFCVVVASQGYPSSPQKGSEITNFETLKSKLDINVFWAGVKKQGDKLVANGGRVLSICKTALDPKPEIYKFAQDLEFRDKYYRTDIGE